MKTIVINEIEYNLPTTWNDISIELFQKINKIKQAEGNDFEEYIKLLCLIGNIPEEAINDLPYKDSLQLQEHIGFLYLTDPEFAEKLVYKVILNDIPYGFDFNISKYSTGMYIDLDTLTKNKEKIIDNLHMIMAILYREIISINTKNKDVNNYVLEKYNSESLEWDADTIKKMPITTAISALVFFSLVGNHSLVDLELFLSNFPKAREMEKLMKMSMGKKKTNRIKKSGDGLKCFTRWLGMIYPFVIYGLKLLSRKR